VDDPDALIRLAAAAEADTNRLRRDVAEATARGAAEQARERAIGLGAGGSAVRVGAVPATAAPRGPAVPAALDRDLAEMTRLLGRAAGPPGRRAR
jgi:hypothetical protein